MNYHDELDLLDQAQTEAAHEADRLSSMGSIGVSSSSCRSSRRRRAPSVSARTTLAQTPPAAGGRRAGRRTGAAASAARQRRAGGVDVSAVPGRDRRADGKTDPRARRGGVRARSPFTVEKWAGPVPTVGGGHRVPAGASAVGAAQGTARSRRPSSRKIYLDRIKKYDPTLLCAVTIMEEQAMAEAAQAPTRRSRPASTAVRCTAFRTA